MVNSVCKLDEKCPDQAFFLGVSVRVFLGEISPCIGHLRGADGLSTGHHPVCRGPAGKEVATCFLSTGLGRAGTPRNGAQPAVSGKAGAGDV